MEKQSPFTFSIRKNQPPSKLYKNEYSMWQKKQLICGVDEVGRGCLSGPIVTVAAILNPGAIHPELKDSKKTSLKEREKLFKWSINNCSYSIGINSNHFIDAKNIYRATQITMQQSLYNLLYKAKIKPKLILIDAMPVSLQKTRFQDIPIKSIIQGESKSASIATASIIAKVVRDTIMQKISKQFPVYKTNKHQGYATAEHIKAIQAHQASFIHRASFLTNQTKEKNEQLQLFC